ncbi:MAG: exodeoxyribonuclease VII small subunit [Candidatus Eisenbacteria bacterium]|nr:exodeoxyribonuclease VII small subunit [Candidatus Eisenbacteria bacterium]
MARDRKPAPGAAGTDGAAELSFEQAIERLQTIVEELESGSLSLEESIARYEEGVKLSRRLTQTLGEAEKRIERLTEDASGAPTTEPTELEMQGPENPGRGGRPAAGGGKPDPEGELPF